jgi:hypothetical protein
VASFAPATLAAPPLDLPWTLHGGRGLFGLDPVHGALMLWAALMAFTLLFVICSALLTRWQWARLNRREAKAAAAEIMRHELTPFERARLRAEAGDLVRQAAVTAAAAKRAQTTVTQTREVCEAAQQAREAAWIAFDAAQRAYEQALREAAGGHSSASSASPASANGNGNGKATGNAVAVVDDEQEKREMSRAALAAFRRGDITVDQLGAVFKQASGWDPLQELQAREVELRRTAESRARRLYQAAAAAERSAVKAADVAAVAAQALAEEAVEVAAEAQVVRAELDAALRVRPRQIPKQRTVRRRNRNPQVSQV